MPFETALLVVKGLELQSFSYHPALFLVAGPVFFLCLPCLSQSELGGGEVIRSVHHRDPLSLLNKDLMWGVFSLPM
eukprot:1145328-Pelagomonas_calceolata.AAC.1